MLYISFFYFIFFFTIKNETFVPIIPLSAPATQVIISNVPPFIGNEGIIRELTRFGKIASSIKEIMLCYKNAALKHVLYFRRHIYKFLSSPTKTLNVSFRVSHGESSYMVYASTETMQCFECRDIENKWFSCPHKVCNREGEGPSEGPSVEPHIVMESIPQQSEKAYVNTEVGQHVSENIVNDPVQVNVVHDEQSEEMDDLSETTEDSCGDDDSCVDFDVANCGSDLYSAEQINAFLDETKGRKLRLACFFQI